MSIIRTLKNTVARTRSILRDEGRVALVRRAAGFGRFLSRSLCSQRDVYLYRHHLIERDRSLYLPRLDSFELRIVETDVEADRLAVDGYEDFRQRFIGTTGSLEAGAVAFCVFVDKKLAHIGWLAVDERGKPHADPCPFQVAFHDGEACTGGTYTMPEFRGKGLMAYGYYERFEYLRRKGFRSTRNSVEVDNVSSHRAHAKFSPEILGRAHSRRILWWSTWTERLFPDGPYIGMPPAADR